MRSGYMVQARDCYNGPGFARASYIAQAMSEARVGRQVRAEFDLGNPDAPQHLFGEKGITVQCEMVDPPMPMGGSGDVLFFRFRRWLDNGHVSPADIAAAPFYSVAVRYRAGIYPDDPRRRWLDKSTFNAPGGSGARLPRLPAGQRPALASAVLANKWGTAVTCHALWLLGGVLITTPVLAAVDPPPASGNDKRIRTVQYSATNPVQLPVSPGASVRIQLGPDETVEQVIVSDQGTLRTENEDTAAINASTATTGGALAAMQKGPASCDANLCRSVSGNFVYLRPLRPLDPQPLFIQTSRPVADDKREMVPYTFELLTRSADLGPRPTASPGRCPSPIPIASAPRSSPSSRSATRRRLPPGERCRRTSPPAAPCRQPAPTGATATGGARRCGPMKAGTTDEPRS